MAVSTGSLDDGSGQAKINHSLSSAGKGLGRRENGITQALKVTLKQDTHGVSLGGGQRDWERERALVTGRGDPWGQ